MKLKKKNEDFFFYKYERPENDERAVEDNRMIWGGGGLIISIIIFVIIIIIIYFYFNISVPTQIISDCLLSSNWVIYILFFIFSACSPLKYEYGGSFYNFSTCEMNHASAVSACSQYGSHLVFIESQEEQDFIEAGASEEYWIGLTGSSLSEARWLDGSNLWPMVVQ